MRTPVTETVRKRYTALIWRGCVTQNVIRQPKLDLRDLERSMQENADGTVSFSDLEYSSDCKSLWGAEYHYGHVMQLIRGFGPERLRTDAAYREKLIGALRFWCVRDFRNPNWWHNEIGTPENLADLALLLYDWLPEDLLASLAAIIDRGSLRGNPKVTERTGANLLWGCSVSIRLAALTGDEELIALASARAAEELSFGAEGIQPDGGFFQHGPRLYSGGYGRSFAYNVALMVNALQNTPYQFPAERLEVFALHMLGGLHEMSVRDCVDWQCIGREYTRPGAVEMGILRFTVELLADAADMVRRGEFVAWRDEIAGAPRPDGTKYFPNVGFLTHHTGGLYVGTKILGGQLLDEEICNGEGVLGYNISYGAHTCAMVTGREYLDAAPYWRYDRIPGTTARPDDDETLLAYPTSWTSRRLPEDAAGGAQSGDVAAVWERADHETVHVLTASFAFPGGFVRLCADIRDDEGAPLHTTVEQSFLTGPIGREGNSYVHGGIRYTPLDGTELASSVATVHGSWKRNSGGEKTPCLSALMLTLTVDHAPGGDGRCAYMLSPADAPAPDVRVVRNDPAEQSVCLPDGRILAVDHRTGTVRLG